jgi:hypothetical protein
VLEKVLPLIREKTNVSIAAWVAEQNALGHVCQCGCGQRIEVRPYHRKLGVPRFIANHHQQRRKGEPRTPHQEGLLPNVPIRQWVLSLPWELRRLAAFNAEVLTALGRIFVEEVFVELRAGAGVKGAHCQPPSRPRLRRLSRRHPGRSLPTRRQNCHDCTAAPVAAPVPSAGA